MDQIFNNVSGRFAFVEFEDEECAARAQAEMD
jgi:hypothetical protein